MKPSERIKQITGDFRFDWEYTEMAIKAIIQHLDEEHERKSMTGYNEGPVDNEGKAISPALTPSGEWENELDELEEAFRNSNQFVLIEVLEKILRRHGRIK